MTLLSHLQSLLEAASPRPWRVTGSPSTSAYNDHGFIVHNILGPDRTVDYGMGPEQERTRIVETDCGHYEPHRPDADLICAAVNALPVLLAVVTAARAIVQDAHPSLYTNLRAALSALEKP